MIAYSFREVRPAIDRGFNEVDEVDRPQPGGAGRGCSSQSAQTLCLADNNRGTTLRRDRAVEVNGLTKKFQRPCSHARDSPATDQHRWTRMTRIQFIRESDKWFGLIRCNDVTL